MEWPLFAHLVRKKDVWTKSVFCVGIMYAASFKFENHDNLEVIHYN
jgi:hypothetical protein